MHTPVLVFPVPGGPWISDRRCVVADFTAATCSPQKPESSLIIAYVTKFPVCLGAF